MADTTSILTDFSMWYNIGMTAGAIMAGVGGFLFGKRKKEDEEKRDSSITPVYEQKQDVINDKLVAFRVLSNADRAKICQFHNGGKFLDGSSMKRFSVTHERCDIGVPFEGSTLQNIVVTIFWDLIVRMKKDDGSVVFTRDLPDGHFKSYYKSHGIDAFNILPIRKDELYIGFLMAEWSDIDKVPSDIEIPKKVIEEYRSSIEVEMLIRR